MRAESVAFDARVDHVRLAQREDPPIDELHRIAALLRAERERLLARWRTQVRELPSARHLDTPALTDHVPQLVDELALAFERRSDASIPEALLEGSPPVHGIQRYADGYDIEEIVAEYNILRGCIHDLADERGLQLQGRPFHVLNLVLDGAIGCAVAAYATQKALEVQQRRQEYLAFVAHDLRTPLNAISLASRVIEMAWPRDAVDPDAARMVKSLLRNVQQLDALVGRVIEENSNLVTETGVRLVQRRFDLWPLVEGLIHDLHPVAGTSSTRLVNRVPEDLVVNADAHLVRRVFQNLIANAIRYTPRGVVEIGAEEWGSAGGVTCWVRDDGTGIPTDRLERIFDAHESDGGEDAGSGSGLGLAIVKTFVEAHGGVVTVESRAGAGSVFTFTLPPAVPAG